MSKIVQVANAMISNPDNISEATVYNGEYFFLYKNKYRWSMTRRGENYYLYFYHENPSMDALMEVAVNSDWGDIEFVAYSVEDIGTTEAKLTFSELYNMIKEKVFGIDDAFKDILSDMDI